MNIYKNEVLLSLYKNPSLTQREIARGSNISLGKINETIKELLIEKSIDKNNKISDFEKQQIIINSPRNAIILAAGYGMRMVPINAETPKGLIEVKKERIIERIIKQLHEVGIKDIYVVVGFMKEKFEYLIDKYNVKLIVNTQYKNKNNLHSLYLAKDIINCSYIIPSDVWLKKNQFRVNERSSWYMLSEEESSISGLKKSKKNILLKSKKNEMGNKAVGIAYIDKITSEKIKVELNKLNNDPQQENSFWEEVLFQESDINILTKIIRKNEFYEINTLEELRELDDESKNLKNETISIIASALNVSEKEIINIEVLKKGMTNRSFLLESNNKKYIMRIPGEGTDLLINRQNESDVYFKIKDKNICDNILYINKNNGYKLTEFFKNARVCDPNNVCDVKKCMGFLKRFHKMQLKVNHTFDIFKELEKYEKLWGGQPSIWDDYAITKKKIYELKDYIDSCNVQFCLTHIDAVPDNFLFINNDEEIKLIDWEYAGMQDPHVDIAMFAIYSLYDKEKVDELIDMYFDGQCETKTRIKIYCYIASCGLLWSNWCEYKRSLGVEFGEYTIRQYRYAKEYYRYAKELMKNV